MPCRSTTSGSRSAPDSATSEPAGPAEPADTTPTDNTAIRRQIDATDRQIDQLVYELCGLTDAEIRIVEEATGR